MWCTCYLWALQARQGPNTQDQAERLMAETGHHLEDTRSPSVPQSRHFRVSAFDSRHTMQWLTRMTAYVTVMFEFATPVLIPLTPLTLCRLPWHFIAWCGGWDSDVIAEDHHKFFKFLSLQ